MANLEQALFGELEKTETDYYGLTKGRIYFLHLPQSVTLPATVYQRISTQRHHAFQADADLSRPRMQLDHYSTQYPKAKETAEACRKLLQNFSGTMGGVNTVDNVAVILTDESEHYEEDTGYYRVRQDYFIFHDEGNNNE